VKRLIAFFQRWWHSDEIEQRDRRLRRIEEELKHKALAMKNENAKRGSW